jgi:hypothetical protein
MNQKVFQEKNYEVKNFLHLILEVVINYKRIKWNNIYGLGLTLEIKVKKRNLKINSYFQIKHQPMAKELNCLKDRYPAK